MNKTGIEWTEFTANPIGWRTPAGGRAWHCEKISPGCKNCYAERLEMGRHGSQRPFTPAGGAELTPVLVESVLKAILTRKKPAKIFLGDMTDLFGHWVKDVWLDQIFAVAALCPQHTFQILTKRPERLAAYLNDPARLSKICKNWYGVDMEEGAPRIRLPDFQLPLPNVHLGISVENQDALESRWHQLVVTPAAVRFISYEPALDAVRWDYVFDPGWGVKPDWVIVGGESGDGARACNLTWVMSAVQQCQAAGVAVFVKQLGDNPHDSAGPLHSRTEKPYGYHGAEFLAFPKALQIRQFPRGKHHDLCMCAACTPQVKLPKTWGSLEAPKRTEGELFE